MSYYGRIFLLLYIIGGGIESMTTNELIIFKKDTDAPGSNRGFVYQYLKTLLLWLNNYKNKQSITIFCEVDDDIKEINLMEQTVRFTQLKCYSTAFNINSDEIKKSFYNYFLLHLIYEGYEGEYVFETNTHISNRDTIIEKWMAHQGELHINEEFQNVCIAKTKEILQEVFIDEKKTMVNAIKKKISKREEKMESASPESEELLLEVEKLDKELEVLQNLAITFEGKIDNDEILRNFTNRITWVFENIGAEDSVDVLKEQVREVLKVLSKDESRVELYFGRLLTEINFKAVKGKKESRFLDNKLLEQILSETDEVIRSGIDTVVLQRFDSIGIRIDQGFSGVNQHISEFENRMRQDIHSLGSKLETQIQSAQSVPEYEILELPVIESDEVDEFIKEENNKNQSKLEGKFKKIEGLDEETRNNLLETATELRCRYLIYLQNLGAQNFHRERQEIKRLEKKVKGICNDAVIELQNKSNINSAEFYLAFKGKLNLALQEFNVLVKMKRFVVDTDVIYGQMFQMASECYLRWHKER